MSLPWKRQKQWQERLGRSKTILWEKLREALASVVPIMVIVLILSFTVAPIPDGDAAGVSDRRGDGHFGHRPVFPGR